MGMGHTEIAKCDAVWIDVIACAKSNKNVNSHILLCQK